MATTAPDDGMIKIIKQINVDNTQAYDLAAKYNINNEEITETYLRKDTTIPASILPSYVDDVIEGYYLSDKFYKTNSTSGEVIAGEANKIYVDLTTNKTYRWSGNFYVVISETLALGETGSTAYAGDKGKANAAAIAALQTKVEDIAFYEFITVDDIDEICGTTIQDASASGASEVSF